MVRIIGFTCLFLTIFVLGIAVGLEVARYHDGKLANLVTAAEYRILSYAGADGELVFK